MYNPFGKQILFGVMGMLVAAGGPVIAASPSEVEASKPLPKVSQGTIDAEVSEAVAPSVDLQSILLADAAAPAVSDLLGSQSEPSEQLFQGDRSLHDLSNDSQGQVTSVSQLSDVQPTDWAFQALQSLVERYGCIAGYPDGTFKGNRSATRYEMAAALNACLDQISDRFASKADLDAVKALQDEFAAELATLRGRVDGLEARVDTVEAQQFSTTTKLKGEAVFGFSGIIGDVADGIAPAAGPDIESSSRLSLTQRARLTFVTSFTGEDQLFTRLQSQNRAINFGGISGTNATRLSFDTGDSENEVTLDRLDYKFPIGDVDITVFANAAFHHYYATTINPYFEGNGGGKGSISWFGERNPIYRNGTVGVSSKGIGTSWAPGDGPFRVDVGYFANAAESAVAVPVGNGSDEGGFFGGGYSALGQVSYQFGKNQVGLTYVRTFDPSGLVRSFAGTTLANSPFGVTNSLTTDSVGAEASFTLSDKFAVGGWVGYTFANQASGASNDAEILNGAINFAILDVLKEGATAGLIAGVPPFVLRSDGVEDSDPPIHLEANYQFPVNANITITPGIIYLINPNGNSVDGDEFVGVIRTTFTF
jgi:hypothetical protein